MPRRPPVTSLEVADRAELERRRGSSSVGTRLAQRAQIVLLAADGVSTQAIAARIGGSRPTVSMWRSRYAQAGLSGLADRSRSGRPSRASEATTTSGGDPLLVTKLSVPG